MGLSSRQFADLIRKADVKGRILIVKPRSIGMSCTMFVNFSNVPSGSSGADFENNRVMFEIHGFDPIDETIPTNRVRIELLVSFEHRKFRARHMKPEGAAKLLVEFIEKVAREEEPRLQNFKT